MAAEPGEGAVAARRTLIASCCAAVVVAAAIGAWAFGVTGLVAASVVMGAFVAVPFARLPKDSDDYGALEHLTRAEHPRLFAVLDEAVRAIGLGQLDVIYVIEEVNAFAARIGGKDALGIGLTLIVTEPMWSLKSTLGHELGHHKGGDLDDAERKAFFYLARLSGSGPPWHPVTRIARAGLVGSALAAKRLMHKQEHRADQWGAFIAGKGTTHDGLKRQLILDAVWKNVVDDLQMLVAAGRAPRNVFALMRQALVYAEDHHELARVDRWIEESDKDEHITHPPTGTRGKIADAAIAKLREDTRDETPGRNLLHDADRVEERVTRRLVERMNDGRELPILDDKELARAAMRLAESRVRTAIGERAGPGAEDLPFAGLFQLIYDVLSGDVTRVRWFAEMKLGSRSVTVQLKPFTLGRGPLAANWLEALLDAAVAREKLSGTVGFGIWRRVDVGGASWYTPGLAAVLAKRTGPWDALLKTLRESEA